MRIIIHRLDTVPVRLAGDPHLDPVRIAQLVEDGVWTWRDLKRNGLAAAFPAEVPEGKKPVLGSERFEQGEDHKWRQVLEFVDPPAPAPTRLRLPKSLVQQRLIDAGKLVAAHTLLMADPISFARWFAPDQPEVFADDPDVLAMLAHPSIDADAAVILAPPELIE